MLNPPHSIFRSTLSLLLFTQAFSVLLGRWWLRSENKRSDLLSIFPEATFQNFWMVSSWESVPVPDRRIIAGWGEIVYMKYSYI